MDGRQQVIRKEPKSDPQVKPQSLLAVRDRVFATGDHCKKNTSHIQMYNNPAHSEVIYTKNTGKIELTPFKNKIQLYGYHLMT